MSDVKQEQKPQQSSGRIPVRAIYLHDNVTVDLPGGSSLMGRIDCIPLPPGRPFFVAHFVPAHQIIELEWHRSDKHEPYRTRLVLSGYVKRFD